MSDIRIARPHGLPMSRAKAAAQAAADDLVREYAITCQWQGDTLHFRRSGVQGRIEVSPSQIALEIRLGLLLKGFKSAIEKSVGKRLEELLAQNAPQPAPVAVDPPVAAAVDAGAAWQTTRSTAAASASGAALAIEPGGAPGQPPVVP